MVGSAAPATVFSPAGADGRTIATGIAYARGRLAVAGRQTGKAFVYGARSGRLISRMRTGLPPKRTWLNDVAFGAHGDAYFTDSTKPVLWRATTRSSTSTCGQSASAASPWPRAP